MADRHSAFADGVRRIVLEQSKRANVGHIGSCLSIADVVAAIFAVLRGAPDDPDRDRFVLSKGHGALALYAALHLKGSLDSAALETFCEDGTALGVHPEAVVDGVDFGTGSLGHGLSIGAGAALAARLQKSRRRAFVLLSDAVCNEGSTWEAVMFAAHHRLGNLIAVVDENGQQALGYTNDVLSLSPLAEKWAAFGWGVHEVDGHDARARRVVLHQHEPAAGQRRELPVRPDPAEDPSEQHQDPPEVSAAAALRSCSWVPLASSCADTGCGLG
jgi:transketolase